MRRHLFIFLALALLLAFFGLGAKSLDNHAGDRCVSQNIEHGSNKTKYALNDSKSSIPDNDAVLESRTSNYRLCIHRVKRIQPSGSSRLSSSLVKVSFSNNPITQYHNQELPSRLYSLVSHCLTVHYYVFALRHILC